LHITERMIYNIDRYDPEVLMQSQNVTERQEADLTFADLSAVTDDAQFRQVLSAAAEGGSICRSKRGVEVLDYDTVAALVGDPCLDSQDASVYERMGGPPSLLRFADQGLLVAMRGEQHRRLKQVLKAGFRVRHVADQQGAMRDLASELADQSLDGPCDFVAAFSSPFPMQVLCQLIGIPAEDVGLFSAAATELHLLAAVPLDPHFPRIEAALRTLADYTGQLIDTRRRHPEDDIITSLIEVQQTAGKLSDEELAWSLVNIIFAGQDTTRYQLASAVYELIQHGSWGQLHRTPKLVPAAVDEALRIRPVTRFVVRIPHEPVLIHDVRVETGRRVILNLMAASADESRFERPQEFRMDRPQRYALPFGWGFHHCLGATLARSEMEAALTVLASKFAEVDLDGQPEFTAPTGMLHGPETLPLRFRR
jgi:cytochrome P450